MQEEIKHSLRESIKREKLFSKSMNKGSLKYFLLEQFGILDAFQDSNFDPMRKSIKQYLRDANKSIKIYDGIINEIGSDDDSGKEPLLFDLERIEEIKKDLESLFQKVTEEGLDLAPALANLITSKARMDIHILGFAKGIAATAEFLKKYNLPEGELPNDLKVSDLFDSSGNFTGLPMDEEEIIKMQSDPSAAPQEETNNLPSKDKMTSEIESAINSIDVSSVEGMLNTAWEELRKADSVALTPIEEKLKGLSDFNGAMYHLNPIFDSLVVKVINGDSIAKKATKTVEGMLAAPLYDVEKLASQDTEQTMEDSGIQVSEQEMVDFIEKYLVKKLGIGGSADNSVSLFLKLADSNAGLLDDSDIRRLSNA